MWILLSHLFVIFPINAWCQREDARAHPGCTLHFFNSCPRVHRRPETTVRVNAPAAAASVLPCINPCTKLTPVIQESGGALDGSCSRTVYTNTQNNSIQGSELLNAVKIKKQSCCSQLRRKSHPSEHADPSGRQSERCAFPSGSEQLSQKARLRVRWQGCSRWRS